MSGLFPAIEPHAHGWLEVGDAQRIYWECCGAPRGKPVVVLHGGPGSGCSPGLRRFFDPSAYRIVLLDQRGCGRSAPRASDPGYDPAANRTGHLLADLERLRAHLEIDRWVVFGVSWGGTLGLAYAERHPDRVRALVLAGVTMTRRREIEWLYRGVAPLFPAAWSRFRAGVPEDERDGNLVEAYHRLLNDGDPAVRERAARDFHLWEAALLSTDPRARAPSAWLDADYRLARARIVTHYFRHAAWLDDDALLRDARVLDAVPGVMVHGRLDVSAPLVTAWELAEAWPAADLVVVDGAGHATGDPGMPEAIVAATERFKAG